MQEDPSTSPPLPVPDEPLKVALIGAGVRAQTIYQPLWESLRPWCVPVAVCDPVAENGRAYAATVGVPYYADIRKLVKDRPMEAAIVVTPAASHHSLSVFLSSNGIPNHTETPWATMGCQAREMAAVARENKVIVRVAENFFRMPIDRFAQTVRDHGYLGDIRRIVSYCDHTGYHNNSRWIVFAQCHPTWVQSLAHDMRHDAFYAAQHVKHEKETLHAVFFAFPNDVFVMDASSGHHKGHLGRHPRPGYTEWQGPRGTLVHRGIENLMKAETELRYVSDAMLAPAQEAAGVLRDGGKADIVTPVVNTVEHDRWTGAYADTPQGRIEYVSPLRGHATFEKIAGRDYYGVAVMDHLVDFALAVRGLRDSEFTDDDALMSEMMDVGARESALQEGRRVALPIECDLEHDALAREQQRTQYGCDPLDVEAMLNVSFPRGERASRQP